jgi:hypothetical protein
MSGSDGSRRGRPLAALLTGVVVALSTIVLPGAPAGASGSAQVLRFGAATEHGGPGETSSPITGLAATSSGNGYWVVSADGAVRGYGDGVALGSASGLGAHRAVDVAGTRTGLGYWVATDDGQVKPFGDAGALGSLAGKPLNRPIVGMASTPSGRGYWLVATDGGVFSFGDAAFHGSTGAMHLNSPIVGMTTAPDGGGYWMVAADGGIFSFGSAVFHGSLGGAPLPSPVVAMATGPAGQGYWLATAAGDVRAFGSAADLGSAPPSGSALGDLAARPSGDGYWLVTGGEPRVAAQSAGPAVTYQPTSVGPGEPTDADFDRLAECESSSRWDLDSHNGYYGGLQFSLATWRSLGGIGRPNERPRLEQIDIGRREWRQNRWRAWPNCARQLGWR